MKGHQCFFFSFFVNCTTLFKPLCKHNIFVFSSMARGHRVSAPFMLVYDVRTLATHFVINYVRVHIFLLDGNGAVGVGACGLTSLTFLIYCANLHPYQSPLRWAHPKIRHSSQNMGHSVRILLEESPFL